MGPAPFGGDYQADLERYIDHDHSDDAAFFEGLALRITLAIRLLRRNYDLTDQDVQELLYLDSSSADAAEMWSALDDAVMGRHPKPSAVGSDAS